MRLDEIIEQAQEDAVVESYIEDIIEWLGECGNISQELEKKIRMQENLTVLKEWIKLAARVSSVEEFEREINISRIDK